MENNTNSTNDTNQRPVKPVRPTGAPVRPTGAPVRPTGTPVRPNMQKSGQAPVKPVIAKAQGNGQTVKPARPVNPGIVTQQPYADNISKSVMRRQAIQQEATQNVMDNDMIDDFNTELVHDTVLENKNRGKVVKQKKVKVEKTPEQKAKIKKTIIIIAVVVVVLALAGLIISTLISSNSKHLNIADPNEYMMAATDKSETESTVESTEETESETEAPVEVSSNGLNSADIKAEKSSMESPLGIDEYGYIDLIVNTKTATDKQFLDHEARMFARLHNYVVGYDSVAGYVAEYNSTNTENKQFTLPSKDEYYAQANGTELVMFEFEVLYPNDFPTSASEGIIYTLPTGTMNLVGTITDIDSEDIEETPDKYIVVDTNIYSVPVINPILVTGEQAEINKPVTYRYIAAVPAGANKDNYMIQFNLGIGTTTYDLYFTGQEVKSSGYVAVPLETTEDGTEETSDTDETESDTTEKEAESTETEE